MKRLLILSVLACSIYSGIGQKGYAQSKQELSLLFKKFKVNNVLSYKIKTIATFPTGEVDTLTNEIYVNKDSMELRYINRLDEVFLNRTWMYRVDHIHKQAGLFNIEKYNDKYNDHKLDIEDIFNMNDIEVLLDSLVISKGDIQDYDKSGDVVYYKISFPETYYIKSYEVRYDEFLNLPVYMRVVYEDNPFIGYFQLGNTLMNIEYYDYSTERPLTMLDFEDYIRFNDGIPTLRKYSQYHFNNIY